MMSSLFEEKTLPKEATWCDETYNIINSHTKCWNQCIYCYAAKMNDRFGRGELCSPIFTLHDEKSKKGFSKAGRRKLFMFPSTHDIFPDMVDTYIEVIKRMTDVGHNVLAVTKPKYELIFDERLCKAQAVLIS